MVEGYGGGGGGFRGGLHFGGRVGVAVLNGSIGLVDLEGRREPKAGRGVCSGLFARRSNLGRGGVCSNYMHPVSSDFRGRDSGVLSC